MLSLMRGKDLCWDFANYHFYNPFALLHQRWLHDYWPSSYLHINIAPAIDFFGYFLVNYSSSAFTTFMMGCLHGINCWLIFLISLIYLVDIKNIKNIVDITDIQSNSQSKKTLANHPYKIGMALLIAVIGICGPTALPGIGSFQNDNLISLFILSFLLLHCKAMVLFTIVQKWSKKYIFFSGLLLGIAIGLKLTAVVFIIGALAAYIVLPIPLNSKIHLIFISCYAVAIGFIISYGYWLVTLWHHYHYLMFDKIIPLSDFLHSNSNFYPRTVFEYLFFPFYFSFDNESQWGFIDGRYPIVFILFIITGSIWLGKYLLQTKTNQVVRRGLNIHLIWLYSFVIFSYFAWELIFSIPRYIVSIEMLVPLIIYLLVKRLIHNTTLNLIFIFVILYTIIFTMLPASSIRMARYDTNYLNLKLPSFIANTHNALVLIAYPAYALNTNPRPLSYLIPLLPLQWRFIGMPFIDEQFHLPDTISAKKIAAIINEYHNNIYLLTTKRNMPEFYRAANQFGLVHNGLCEAIYDDRQYITHENTLICPVKKYH
jgi:hypothetical protein